MDLKKTVSIVLTSTLLLSMLLIAIPKVHAQTTVEFVPLTTSITTLNQEFTVTCWINDVTDLAGFDLQLAWDTAYIQYVSHPTPVLGCLISPTFTTKDVIDDPGLGPGTYWLAAATLSGTGFTGSGIAFEMTFRAINVPEGTPGTYFDTLLTFTSHDLADSLAQPIPHTAIDGIVRIYYSEPVPHAVPVLMVDPAVSTAPMGSNFDVSVVLLGDDMNDLDPYWFVAGIDVYMNFNSTLMEAVSITIDPDGDFLDFFADLYIIVEEINNAEGYVHVAYTGIPKPIPQAPYGVIRMFSVTFTALTESNTFPPPEAPITLRNPIVTTGAYFFDSIGLADLADPTASQWNEIVPNYGVGPYDMPAWTDDGDGVLSAGDQVRMLDIGSGFYFDYLVKQLTGTLNVTLCRTMEDYLWAASFGPDNLADNGLPGRYLGTDDPYDGFGVPYWTGNFSLGYPIDSVNSITVTALPFTGDEYTYTLTEGVDFIVHADEDLIELLTPVDVYIENEEWTDGVDNSLNGWPYINYVASSFESVFVDMHNGTARFARNDGYAMEPPSEYWFDPDWTWELEGWWALGYYDGPWVWPDGSTWWINYTAASYLTVDYNTDPTTAFVDYNGTYDDFLSVAVPTPINTTWNEVYPKNWNTYMFVDWMDTDTSGDLSVGDFLVAPGSVLYSVNSMGTDITCGRLPWICEDSPTDQYFGWAPIVAIAGYPQRDNDKCPWHNKDYSVPLPHKVIDGVFKAYYKPLGGFIDLFSCNSPDGLKGIGMNVPTDMRWPQKELCLCANVTYAGWPEQNKDVAFEIKRPLYDEQTGEQIGFQLWTVVYARTNETGYACTVIRLPWPCDDPEAYFGVWKVWATVDVACVVVNDTMEFKYDYRVRIWDVQTDKTEYKHCEDIVVTISYGTVSMATFNITFTLTVTDASGVPIGFAYEEVTVGGAQWCTYANGSLTLSVHVVKWARPIVGTIYVGALSDFPQNGGSAETPVYVTRVSILAAWANP